MGKEICCAYKYNRSKISSPTLKKPVLLSSANHTSYPTNLTGTIMSHQLQHKDSFSIKNRVNTSNTDDIHSCVTPRKQNISVRDTSTPPRLTPLTTTLPLLPVELPKQHIYSHLVNNICVSRWTTNILMLLNVSNQGY